jgi:CheY-like chemotaxis protein
VVIEVQDSGIGIAPDALYRIFDVLEQGGVSNTRRFGGLGLGLTISRSILEQHGGTLTAFSDGPDRGATFTIDLPTIVPPDSASVLDSPAAPAAAPVASFGKPLCVLLVEDNRDTLNYLARSLRARGYDVHPAVDMTSALVAAAETVFDVIVSDIELPDGSGLELMWSVRASQTVPAIALSGFGSAADIEQSRAAGFALHLTKPVDFRQLDRAIQQVAAQHEATSGAGA